MRGAGRAFAWEFTHRHRWGFGAIAISVAAIVFVRLAFFDFGETVRMDRGETFAILVVVPLTIVFTYLLAVFTFGLTGDIGARQSMFPSRLFTLPVSSAELAWWPMLFGATLMAALWLIFRAFAVWPSGVPIPVFWPALAIASLLAWAQALTWMPYPLPGLRVIATLVCLTLIETTTFVALHFKASEVTMAALLAPQVPLAYLVARIAVARARQGLTPDWTIRRDAGQRIGAQQFASAESAQAWFEWKRHGMALPFLVACLLPFELAILWATGETKLVYVVLLGVMLTPPFLAGFTAATIARPNQSTGDAHGVSPFVATRPLSSAALIAAKLKMTVWSTLAAWLLVIVAVPIALALSGTSGMVLTFARTVVADFGAPRALVLLLLAIGAFALTTWRMLVQTLYVGLAGRVWLTRTWLSLTLLALCLVGPAIELALTDRRLVSWLWSAARWLIPLIALLKLAAGFRVTLLLYRSGLLSDRALLAGAAGWSAAVLAIYALFAWWIDTTLFPVHLLGAVAILLVPLARLSAAPLALAWNRHR